MVAVGGHLLRSPTVAVEACPLRPWRVKAAEGHPLRPRRVKRAQVFDISGTVVDFDTHFAADLETEIMHPGPRLCDFVVIQAEQLQRMKSLQQQVDSQQNEMRNAAAAAAQAERYAKAAVGGFAKGSGTIGRY